MTVVTIPECLRVCEKRYTCRCEQKYIRQARGNATNEEKGIECNVCNSCNLLICLWHGITSTASSMGKKANEILDLYTFFFVLLSSQKQAPRFSSFNSPQFTVITLRIFPHRVEATQQLATDQHVHLGVDRAWTPLNMYECVNISVFFWHQLKICFDRSKAKKSLYIWTARNAMHVKSGETQMYLTCAHCTVPVHKPQLWLRV